MGIEVGFAVATVGVGKIVSKLASKGSKIMQTRHRPIAAEPDKIAAWVKADKALLPTKEYVKPQCGKLIVPRSFLL